MSIRYTKPINLCEKCGKRTRGVVPCPHCSFVLVLETPIPWWKTILNWFKPKAQ